MGTAAAPDTPGLVKPLRLRHFFMLREGRNGPAKLMGA
jgi:hypothetical protein